MISYRDMTFCNSDCVNAECERRYTTEIHNDAEVWWGNSNAPIAITNYSSTCKDYIGKDYEQEN